MAALGFHVYAHDHRGHGATNAPDAPPGIFGNPDGASKVIADVAAIHDLIAREHPGLPVIVFGHSMGGFIALNFVLRHSARVQAAAIWNANFSAGLLGRVAQAILAYERFRLGSDMPSRMIPKLTFQAWAKQMPDRRTDVRLAVARSRRGRQICRRPAVRLGRVGVDVERRVPIRVLRRRRPQLRIRAARTCRSILSAASKDPATDGGKAVHDLAKAHGADGIFACDDAGLRGNPARNPERVESKHHHRGFRCLGRQRRGILR